ncbi:MAG: MmgE/PrpD family protein [Acidobacteria bacterium]|nr:MmgE/PrpD family protein [Acidobacteriota bacterium]
MPATTAASPAIRPAAEPAAPDRATAGSAVARFAAFIATAEPPPEARAAARDAVLDTVGVALAGSVEPSARIVHQVAHLDGSVAGPSFILGTSATAGPGWAALANGTAAHALDFDDMCWVTLAHPSTPLVAAALAAAEAENAPGLALLDAYVVGFEVEAALGRAMNRKHYEQGWHCTATIGTIGAAAAAARVYGLDAGATGRALAIAASEASGLKENFGTMVKPLQAGLAARNGVLAALFAREGLTASDRAIDGPQGFLVAMQSAGRDLAGGLDRLGREWEIVDGGITVKLYPSCAATHPTIDTLLDLRRETGIGPADVEAVEIDVDPVVPTVLIHDRPTTGLEGKFSLHYCAAAALAFGRVDIDTFETAAMQSPDVVRLVPRVTMRADERLGRDAPPLTEARITLRLTDGRTLERAVRGARGYPENPASAAELDDKFLACAQRAVPPEAAEAALGWLRTLDEAPTARSLACHLATRAEVSASADAGASVGVDTSAGHSAT